MSTKIDPSKYEGMNLREMIRKANKDVDPVSVFILGQCDKPSEWGGCVVIVKGGENAFKVRNILANAGLLDTTNRIDHL